MDVYQTLEPFLEDRRKLRRKGRTGTKLTFMDEFVDELLTKDRVCATSLWKMPKREVLEDLEVLEPRVSPLGDIEDILDEEDDGEVAQPGDDSDAEDDGANGVKREPSEGSRDRGSMDMDEDDRPRTRSPSP